MSDEAFCDDETAPEDDPNLDNNKKQAFEDRLNQIKGQLGSINPDTVFRGQVTIDGQNFEIAFSAGELLEILDGYDFVFSSSLTTTNGAGGSFDDFAVVDPSLLDLINTPTIQGQNINSDIADWLIVHEVGHQLRAVESLTNGQFQQWAADNSQSLAGLSAEQVTERWQQTSTFSQLESMNNSVGRTILGAAGISSFWSSPGAGYNATLTLTLSIEPGAGQAGADLANECGGASGSSTSGGTPPSGGSSSGSGGYGGGGGGGTSSPDVNLH